MNLIQCTQKMLKKKKIGKNKTKLNQNQLNGLNIQLKETNETRIIKNRFIDTRLDQCVFFVL